jgi:hypothetical protein
MNERALKSSLRDFIIEIGPYDLISGILMRKNSTIKAIFDSLITDVNPLPNSLF